MPKQLFEKIATLSKVLWIAMSCIASRETPSAKQVILKKLIIIKGGFKSEDTGEFFHCQHKYSKSLSWAENFNFPPKTVNNLFKFSAQDSDLEYLCWQRKFF